MKMKSYSSDPLPISLPKSMYYDGVNSQVAVYERINEPATAKEVIDFINSGSDVSKLSLYGEDIYYVPTRTIRIPVDPAAVIANGTVRPEDADRIVPYIDIKLKGSWIIKSQLIILDILANNNWKRPVYFVTGYHNDAMGLEEYFQMEGLGYRLVPIRSENKSWFTYGRIDNDILYNNLMNKFAWGGAGDPAVYIDYYHKRTIKVIRARLVYARLASELAAAGDTARAAEVVQRCMELFPVSQIGYDLYISDVVQAWFSAGKKSEATALARDAARYYFSRTEYLTAQKPYIVLNAEQDIAESLQIVSQILQTCYDNGETAMAEELNKKLSELYAGFLSMKK